MRLLRVRSDARRLRILTCGARFQAWLAARLSLVPARKCTHLVYAMWRKRIMFRGALNMTFFLLVGVFKGGRVVDRQYLAFGWVDVYRVVQSYPIGWSLGVNGAGL